MQVRPDCLVLVMCRRQTRINACGGAGGSTYWVLSSGKVQIIAIASTLNHLIDHIVAEGDDEGLRRDGGVAVRGAVEHEAALGHLERVHGGVRAPETQRMSRSAGIGKLSLCVAWVLVVRFARMSSRAGVLVDADLRDVRW